MAPAVKSTILSNCQTIANLLPAYRPTTVQTIVAAIVQAIVQAIVKTNCTTIAITIIAKEEIK